MRDQTAQRKKAEILLAFHKGPSLLVLPNFWDPLGARILEAKGYPAVATASAAVSASLGYADGEKVSRSTLISTISRIAESVDVPVTADIESGYGSTLETLEETIRQVILSGVAGVNIEDSLKDGGGLRPIAEQCERIFAVRKVGDRQGIHLVINARVDSFLSNLFSSLQELVEDAVMRASAYITAGADCIYPIGPGDATTIIELRRRISGPLNTLAKPSAAPLAVLHHIGINRVSFGPFIFRSCLKKFMDIIEALQEHTGYECFADQMASGSDLKPFLIQEAEGK
jgi:2-methylisocitrate lyase-like PEP mutase family enzyme